MKSARRYIIEREAANPPRNNETRTYLYVRPIKNGEACIEVWAAKNERRTNRLLTKSVYRFYTNRKKYQVRDMVKMWFSIGKKLVVDFSESGYGRSYYAELGARKGVWDYDLHRFGETYMPLFAPLLNSFDGTKYKYCAYDHNCGLTILDYIELFKINPQVELFSKAGAFRFLSRTFLAQLREDADFASWFRRNVKQIMSEGLGIRAVRQLYGRTPRCDQFNATMQEERRTIAAIRREEERVRREQERQRREEEVKRMRRQAAKNSRAIRKLYEAIKDICGKYGAYEAVVPQCANDLIDEGEAMHNCVGHLYPDKVASGKAILVFLRRGGKPVVDIEINPNTFAVVQVRKVCNHDADKGQWAIARQIASKIKRMRKAA